MSQMRWKAIFAAAFISSSAGVCVAAPPDKSVDHDTMQNLGIMRFAPDFSSQENLHLASGHILVTLKNHPQVDCTGTAIAVDAVLTAYHCIWPEGLSEDDTLTVEFSQNLDWMHSNDGKSYVVLERKPVVIRDKATNLPHEQRDMAFDYVVLKTVNTDIPLIPFNFIISEAVSDYPHAWTMWHHPEKNMKLSTHCAPVDRQPKKGHLVRVQCFTDLGSSGALIAVPLIVKDKTEIYAGALFRETDKLPDGLRKFAGRDWKAGLALRLSRMRDLVCDKTNPAPQARALFELDREWTKRIGTTDYELPSVHKLFSDPLDPPRCLPGDPLITQADPPPPPTAFLGYSPPTNAVFKSGYGPRRTWSEFSEALLDFQISGTSSAIMQRLTRAVPPEFRPAKKTKDARWIQEVLGPEPVTTSTLRLSDSQVLPSGISVSLVTEMSKPATATDRCRYRQGYAFAIPGAGSLWNLESFQQGALGQAKALPAEAPCELADDRAGTADTSTLEYERSLIQNVVFKHGDSLVPAQCEGPATTECSSLLRFNLISEGKLQGKRIPATRKRVSDLVSVRARTPSRAVVEIRRCVQKPTAGFDWPSLEVVRDRCAAAATETQPEPITFLQEYKKGQGVVCEMWFDKDKAALVRNRLEGHADARCLLDEAKRNFN